MESFDDIDNLTELFWNIEDPKTASKYNLTQFSLHYLLKKYGTHFEFRIFHLYKMFYRPFNSPLIF